MDVTGGEKMQKNLDRMIYILLFILGMTFMKTEGAVLGSLEILVSLVGAYFVEVRIEYE